MDKKRKEMKYNNLTFIKQTDIVIFHKTCRITKLLSTAEESEFIAIVSNSFPFYNRIAIYNKRHFYYLQRIANSLSSASGIRYNKLFVSTESCDIYRRQQR